MWIRALNGVVVEVPDAKAAEYVEQGHSAFDTEDAARGKPAPKSPAKATAKRKS